VKRICILSPNRLYREGIETLLAKEEGIEIVSPEGEDVFTEDFIEKYKPDVIIVDYDDLRLDLAPAVLCMLKQRLGTCVIGLSLRDNTLSICRGDFKDIRQVEDLVKAIL